MREEDRMIASYEISGRVVAGLVADADFDLGRVHVQGTRFAREFSDRIDQARNGRQAARNAKGIHFIVGINPRKWDNRRRGGRTTARRRDHR